MGKKVINAVKAKLRNDYEQACNGYLMTLLGMWELDAYYGSWVGDEVGGLYDYGGSFVIGMDDIIYCVENDVTELQYQEWLDYCSAATEFNMTTPNLKSWMMGCPRTDQETFRHLYELKADLAKAVDDEKERIEKIKKAAKNFNN